MICKDCRNDHHTNCKGGTWCDCKHLDRREFPVKR